MGDGVPNWAMEGVFMISTCCHGNHEHSKHSFANRTISLIIYDTMSTAKLEGFITNVDAL